MGPLTETRITEVVLGFLRERYKYYPLRSGNIDFKMNLRGSEGVIVDGAVFFPREGKTAFQATVEATDFLKRDELWFKTLWELAIWDGLAISAGMLSLVFAYLHFTGKLVAFGGSPWLLAGTGLLLLLGLSWMLSFLLRSLRRYRYIYAIEQFKSYAANEQWIAFAWDVFPGYNSPYFLELREQCVIQGLGLLEVERDGRVKMHLSPAKEGFSTQGKRKIINLFSINEGALDPKPQIEASKFRISTGAFLERLSGKEALNDLLRFQRPIWRQLMVIALSTTLTLSLMVREYGKRPVIFEDERAYELRMLEKKLELENAGEEFISTVPPDTKGIAPFNPRVRPYLKVALDTLQMEAFAQDGWFSLEEERLQQIPCEKVFPRFKGKYLIMAGRFSDQEYLQTVMSKLQMAGIPVNAVWGECFFERSRYYILVFPDIFSQTEPAQRAAVKINELLYEKGFTLNARFVRIE